MNAAQPYAARPRAKKQRFPFSLYCLTLGAFAIGMTEFVIMGLLPNVAADLNVTIPQAGQLITSYALGVAFGAPVLTVATHRVPPKLLLLLLMGIFIAGNVLSVIAPNYPFLIVTRIVTALAHGTFLGAGTIMASKLVAPERRAAAVSMVLAGLSISNIVGVPFGTFIGQQFGWRASFAAIALLGVVALLGIARFIPVIGSGESSNLSDQVRGLFNRKVMVTLLTGAFCCASLFSLFTYITPILIDISGFQEASVTWILVLFGIGITLGNLLGGKLADWRPMGSTVMVLAALAVILALLPFAFPNSALAVASVFIWGVAAFAVLPGVQVRIMTLAKAPLLASSSSHSVMNAGNAGGAYLGGVVITYAGLSYVPYLASALALCSLGGAVAGFLLERKRQPAAAAEAVAR
ncbi:MFS transporter [Cohnella massiliensis]|uniref:MFS transporter n=1 Tax=Cohnella massiliensis TaxID=1816691 RepID=UPI0009BA46D4|nr:MFS transporter [Cohnella massiliensis]